MDENLNKALKKAKRKQLFKVIGITVLTVLILIPVIFKVGDYFAAKNADRLHDALFLKHAITQPNIQIDSQVKAQNAIFGGNIVTNRSKNVNGYLVQWSTLTSKYDWLFPDMDSNELTPGFYRSGTKLLEYDKQTKQKSATFYHPLNQDYYHIPHELEAVATMEGHVAEVAISFDQPYTFSEIEAKIPDNLNIVWLYMTSPIVDESEGPAGLEIYGFEPFISEENDTLEDSYEGFVSNLEAYDPRKTSEILQAFLNENEGQSFAEVEILGMMLTGQAKNFKALEDESFIRASSVGVTAEMVPYIEPEK